ncbi:MAG: hypothetical protein IKW16_00120, partial [Clostridia bacterium]|nr:hypothetical protein [Clostridia bacterium]
VTMMFSPCNSKRDFKKTEKALLSLKKTTPITTEPPCPHILKVGMPANKALVAESEDVSINDAVGRILSSPTISCPPAIPVVVSGEIIDERAVEIMEYYSIHSCNVVKKPQNKLLYYIKSKF